MADEQLRAEWISPQDRLTTGVFAVFNVHKRAQYSLWDRLLLDDIAYNAAVIQPLSITRLRWPGLQFKYMIQIMPVKFPTQVSVCPSIEKIGQQLRDGTISLIVSNYEGNIS